MAGLALLAGLLLGAVAVVWWLRRKARAQRRIPRRWPLSPRLVANSKEREVWRWLLHAFASHHVMIKMPVTRFTMPRNKEQGLRWYRMLSGVYCTFTVCNSEGHVIGCVDVPGRLGLSKKNELLKRKLLRQCGIAYVVVEAGDLPHVDDIRADFLGEAAAAGRRRQRNDRGERAVNTAHHNLRQALGRRRMIRDSEMAPLSLISDSMRGDLQAGSEYGALGSRFAPESAAATLASEFASLNAALDEALQSNSFLAPLDSREADLN